MSQLKNISEDTREHLKALQNEMLSCAEKLELPLVHYFVNGVYGREIFIPAGVLVAGRIHKTEHISIISQGIVEVVIDVTSLRAKSCAKPTKHPTHSYRLLALNAWFRH